MTENAYESQEKIHRMFLDLSSIEKQLDLHGLVSTITTELPAHPEDIRKKLIVPQT